MLPGVIEASKGGKQATVLLGYDAHKPHQWLAWLH